MANAKTSLFPLPASQVVETVYVQLDSGAIVARTPAELAAMPAGTFTPIANSPAK